MEIGSRGTRGEEARRDTVASPLLDFRNHVFTLCKEILSLQKIQLCLII